MPRQGICCFRVLSISQTDSLVGKGQELFSALLRNQSSCMCVARVCSKPGTGFGQRVLSSVCPPLGLNATGPNSFKESPAFWVRWSQKTFSTASGAIIKFFVGKLCSRARKISPLTIPNQVDLHTLHQVLRTQLQNSFNNFEFFHFDYTRSLLVQGWNGLINNNYLHKI